MGGRGWWQRRGQEPPSAAMAHQAEEAAVASHLPGPASPPPPGALPLAAVGKPARAHEQQRLPLGKEGKEPLPEHLAQAPEVPLPYPLGEAVQGLEGGARAVGGGGLMDSHRLPVGGPQVGPEEEEGQIEAPPVDSRVAPLALGGPALVMGLGHHQADLERSPQPLPIPTHSITSLPRPLARLAHRQGFTHISLQGVVPQHSGQLCRRHGGRRRMSGG